MPNSFIRFPLLLYICNYYLSLRSSLLWCLLLISYAAEPGSFVYTVLCQEAFGTRRCCWSSSLLNCLWHELLLAKMRDTGWPQYIQNKTTLKECLPIRSYIINWLCNLKLSLGAHVCIYEKRRTLNASSLEISVQDQEMIELYYLIFSLWGNSRFLIFFNRTGTLCIIKILSP